MKECVYLYCFVRRQNFKGEECSSGQIHGYLTFKNVAKITIIGFVR